MQDSAAVMRRWVSIETLYTVSRALQALTTRVLRRVSGYWDKVPRTDQVPLKRWPISRAAACFPFGPSSIVLLIVDRLDPTIRTSLHMRYFFEENHTSVCFFHPDIA